MTMAWKLFLGQVTLDREFIEVGEDLSNLPHFFLLDGTGIMVVTKQVKRLNDPVPSEMVQNRNHYRWHEHYVNSWTRLG